MLEVKHNRYYVYSYLREDGTPYYIGKGTGDRAWVKNQSEVGKPTDKSRIIIVEKNLTNVGALAIERRLIEWYGRKDLGTGILRNQTAGGDGAPSHIGWNKGMRGVYKLSAETKLKMSQTRKGVKKTDETRRRMSIAFTGRKHSKEARLKMRKVQRAAPKLKCPHCDMITTKGNIRRWHGDNCRSKANG